jgi:hypothetical protein
VTPEGSISGGDPREFKILSLLLLVIPSLSTAAFAPLAPSLAPSLAPLLRPVVVESRNACWTMAASRRDGIASLGMRMNDSPFSSN